MAAKHRRIELEDQAEVVASDWGAEALAGASVFLKQTVDTKEYLWIKN